MASAFNQFMGISLLEGAYESIINDKQEEYKGCSCEMAGRRSGRWPCRTRLKLPMVLSGAWFMGGHRTARVLSAAQRVLANSLKRVG